MSHSSPSSLWHAGPTDDQPYARMIPGRGAAVIRAASEVLHLTARTYHPTETWTSKFPATTWKWWLRGLLIPHPDTSDAFTLYSQVMADFLLLLTSSLVCAYVFPSLGVRESVLPVYAVLVTLFAFTEGLYRDSTQASLAKVMATSGRVLVLSLVLIFLTERDMPALMLFLLFCSGLATLVGRRAWNRSGTHSQATTGCPRNVLIVGAGPLGQAIASALTADPSRHSVVRGFVDEQFTSGILGGIDHLAWVARAEFIDEVILAIPNQPGLARQAAELARQQHLDVRAVLDLPADSLPGIERIGNIPVITVHREAMPKADLFLKRVLDITGSLLGLLISAPLMAVIALMIRLDSRGPVIYSAKRIGAKGRTFRCYKFRSMIAEADFIKEALRMHNQREGPTFKIDNDPRITRVGRFLRRYSLDELPQLWNVLRGDMSLVGPRPHPLDDVSQYELRHYRRLDVKPGVTGLWQITARENPSFELNMHLDLTYIENWSPFLDLRILLRTIRVLFTPQGT